MSNDLIKFNNETSPELLAVQSALLIEYDALERHIQRYQNELKINKNSFDISLNMLIPCCCGVIHKLHIPLTNTEIDMFQIFANNVYSFKCANNPMVPYQKKFERFYIRSDMQDKD